MEIIKLLKKIDGLPVAPVSSGTDKQNTILQKELFFKVYEYKSGREHNGWVVPQNWEVVKAEIRKNGKLIYDGKKHPLGVIGYSQSFRGKISLSELKKHLFFKKEAPKNIVYHCDLYYKTYLKMWGFSVPYDFYASLDDGLYEVVLETHHSAGTMKALEYTHKGRLKDAVIFNAHNCHAAQLNDGPAGYAVFIDVMKELAKRKTKYTYRLVIAPEHMGSVFYLADKPEREIKNFKYGIF
ncbi:MAG: DUF4910 domain-containing protein, partial [Patescibacteria group bacterium]